MELASIQWYSDDDLAIFFNRKPNVRMRYPEAGMSTLEKNACLMYPFENLQELKVAIFDHTKEKPYKFTIRAGYCYDGATIPRIFWRLVGAKTDPAFLVPALIHDYMCENHECVNNDRYLADKVFERLLYVSGVKGWKRWLMFNSVDLFQRFCGW